MWVLRDLGSAGQLVDAESWSVSVLFELGSVLRRCRRRLRGGVERGEKPPHRSPVRRKPSPSKLLDDLEPRKSSIGVL